MKQMVMLEKADLEALRGGQTLTLAVGAAQVIVGYEGARSVAPVAAAMAVERNGTGRHAADVAGSARSTAQPRWHRSHSDALKAQVVMEASDPKPGDTWQAIANRHNLARSLVVKWVAKARARGEVTAAQRSPAHLDQRLVKIGRSWQYPEALRRQVVADVVEYGSVEKAAKAHRVPWRQVYVWKKKYGAIKKGGK